MNEHPNAHMFELAITDYCPCCATFSNRRIVPPLLWPLFQALETKKHGIYLIHANENYVETAELYVCQKCLIIASDGDTYPATEDHSVAVYRALAKEK